MYQTGRPASRRPLPPSRVRATQFETSQQSARNARISIRPSQTAHLSESSRGNRRAQLPLSLRRSLVPAWECVGALVWVLRTGPMLMLRELRSMEEATIQIPLGI